MRSFFGIAAIALLLVAGCSSGGSEVSSTSSSASNSSSQSSATSSAASTDGGDTDSELTLGDETYGLEVQSCSLGPDGGAVGIVAVTSDGKYEFSAGGAAGAVTITLRGVGNPSVWTAKGANPTTGASTFGYSGTVAGPEGDEQLSVSINC